VSKVRSRRIKYDRGTVMRLLEASRNMSNEENEELKNMMNDVSPDQIIVELCVAGRTFDLGRDNHKRYQGAV